MYRLIAAGIAGVLAGIAATSLVLNNGIDSHEPAQTAVRSDNSQPNRVLEVFSTDSGTPVVGAVDLATIMALPSVFERTTALHLLASQSDASETQNLIFEANEIVDEFEKDEALVVLFSRLTELDPRTALQLARTDPFAGAKSVERSIWRTWAHTNFDDALFEAKTQTSMVLQKSAAQSLYFAFGYLGNEKTDRIEDELGIEPDWMVRSRYLYALADRSIAEAIDFINELDDEADKRQYASWLAHHASIGDPHAAATFASRFNDKSVGDHYDNIVQRNLVRDDPHAAIERLQATGKANRSNGEFHSAVAALVKVDMAAALEYFNQSRSRDARRTFGTAIATQMAKEDPEGALAWAREHDTEQYSFLQAAVLQQIAKNDPQLALAEALKPGSAGMHSNLISNVMYHIANQDPQEAAAMLAQISDEDKKIEASHGLVQYWLRSDPDAAINWILTQDDDMQANLMQMAASRLARSDIDAAIRLLPRLDAKLQPGVRQQIARQLATTGSAEEARSFIQQFDGQPGFEQLKASVIAGVARTDVMSAKHMADQLGTGDARDQAYMQIISRHAERDPADAVRWLRNIENEALRASASGQIAAQWARQDAAAAERWVSEMPSGSTRDGAIMHMTSQWREPSEAQHRLINSIENRDIRGQAKIRLAYNLMHTDIEKARELLRDADIPEYQRQQAELMFSRMGSRF